MKKIAALFGFILCACLETQGAPGLEPLPQIFPGALLPRQTQRFPNLEEEHDKIHRGHGSYGGYGGYEPYGPEPEPEPRPRPQPRCTDKNAAFFCKKAKMNNRCEWRKYWERCEKTCGVCEDKRDCEDTSLNCNRAHYRPQFYCSLSWFSTGCKKTCNLCLTVTTSTPAPTPEPEECIDTSNNCQSSNIFRCNMFWFKSGCRKSCKVCKPTTISTMPSTISSAKTITTSTLEETTTEETTAATEATPPETRTTTEATTTIETNEPEITPEGSGIESVCVDTDAKNCQTWESIGLCYNPKYEEDMAKLCRLSCQLCQP